MYGGSYLVVKRCLDVCRHGPSASETPFFGSDPFHHVPHFIPQWMFYHGLSIRISLEENGCIQSIVTPEAYRQYTTAWPCYFFRRGRNVEFLTFPTPPVTDLVKPMDKWFCDNWLLEVEEKQEMGQMTRTLSREPGV